MLRDPSVEENHGAGKAAIGAGMSRPGGIMEIDSTLPSRSNGAHVRTSGMMSPEYEELVLESFGLCVVAFLVVVTLHLTCLHFCLRRLQARFPIRNASTLRYHQAMFLILSNMLVLFALHMLTNFAWGYFIYLEGAVQNFREGVFFSLENYTSLGLTRVNVDDRWRMLAPMISLSGVFCLSWSTAVLVSFFGRLYSNLETDVDG